MNYQNFYPCPYPYYDPSAFVPYYPPGNPWPYPVQPAASPYQPTQYYTEQYVDKNNVFHPPKESSKPERVLSHISTADTVPLPSEPFPGGGASSARSSRSKDKQKDPVSEKIVGSKNQSASKETSAPKKTPKTQPPAYRFAPYGRNDEWKLAPNRDILVVDPRASDAVPISVINLRKPSESKFASDYTAVSPPSQAPQKYESTVSNRLGISGRGSLHTMHNPVAHSQGIGKYLLQKMGWSEGKPIGCSSTSDLEPLGAKLGLKLNKKGLGVPGGQDDVPEHACAFLNEKCRELSWRLPQYILVSEDGPPHQKSFLFKILLNGEEYSANVPGSNKKIAKANIAKVCIDALFRTAKSTDVSVGLVRPSFNC